MIEVAIGVSIAALVVTFIGHAITRFAAHGRESVDKIEAIALAEEGIEVMRYLRDESWVSLRSMTNGAEYFLTISTTTIATTTVPALINGQFRRSIVVHPVYRATSGDDPVASTSVVSKAIDPDTKLITVTVSYGTPTTTLSLSSYLTNI